MTGAVHIARAAGDLRKGAAHGGLFLRDLVAGLEALAEYHLVHSEHGVYGRADLVGHIGQKIALCLVGPVRVLLGPDQLVRVIHLVQGIFMILDHDVGAQEGIRDVKDRETLHDYFRIRQFNKLPQRRVEKYQVEDRKVD